MSFEVNGKLEVIFDTQQISDRFRKREFVLLTRDGMYEEHIKMQVLQDKCGLLDKFEVGDEVKVSFNLKGKPYQKGSETMYFTNLDAWRIERLQSEKADSSPAPQSAKSQSTGAQSTNAQNREYMEGMTFSESAEEDPPF